jgi:phage terminase small subunit
MREPKRDARRKKIVEQVKATGAKPTPEEVGCSRMTLWRDLTALQQQGDLKITDRDKTEMVAAQYEVYLRMEEALIQGTLEPEIITAWTRVRESIAKLLGLNAPSRSESLNVNVDTDPQKLGPYQWFCYVTRGLSLEEIRQPMTDLCEQLRSEKEPEPIPQPPKNSPLWHPQRKELSE